LDHLFLFIFLALLAEIIGTVGGFGSSLFFIPIASYFLDFHSVLGVTALFHVFSNLTKIYFFRKGFDKKLILNIGIPAVIFVVVGAFLSKSISSKYLEFALALFLIVTSITFFIFQNINVKASNKNAIIGGSISGLIAGLIGTGGAIRGITLAAFNLNKEVFIATSAIIDLGIDLSRSAVYTLNGFVHKDDLYLIPILILVSIIGTYLGKIILNYLTELQFKKIVLILIFITGIITILRVLF
jgi:uncharacterized membrane protein YfcA